jgi:CheY-like chemotaxis protein
MSSEQTNLIDVRYIGFAPEVDSDSYIQDALTKLRESCPYGSRLVAQFTDLSDRYRLELFVYHQFGKFTAVSEEVTIGEALNLSIGDIYKKIDEWRLTRFKMKEGESVFDVLLVDDDPLSIKVLEACFQQNGCRTVAVENGERALEKIEKKKFDLIVMDWNMPRLDGGQTICALDRKISQRALRPESEKMPVLTYSIYEKNKIQFPNTKNFFRIGHLSKMASYRALQSVTSEFLRRLKGSTGLKVAIQ